MVVGESDSFRSLFVAGQGVLPVIVSGSVLVSCCDGRDLCSDCFFLSLSKNSLLPVVVELVRLFSRVRRWPHGLHRRFSSRYPNKSYRRCNWATCGM